MSLLVLAYPEISQQDFDWIQQTRHMHDKRYFHLFAPHFTLVFPTPDELLTPILPHVKAVAAYLQPIDFVLRCALVVKDSFSEFTGVFLVPDEGFGRIVRAHDALYTGVLKKELRLDIPYIPHVGIANKLSAATCKRLANKINSSDLTIKGGISYLDVVTWAGSGARSVIRYSLGQPNNSS